VVINIDQPSDQVKQLDEWKNMMQKFAGINVGVTGDNIKNSVDCAVTECAG
jgi:hypothetical protein